MEDLCPHCGHDRIDREFVEHTQCRPAECYGCGAREFYNAEDGIEAMDVELYCGWHMGHNPDGLCDADMAQCSNVYLILDDKKRNRLAIQRVQLRRVQRERQEQFEEQAKVHAARQRYHDEALF